MAAAQKQAQIDRMKQLVKKQKKEMQEQQKLIADLQNRVDNMYDLPADVQQLKTMIGEMRGEINRKDSQVEVAMGDAAQNEAELKSLKIQLAPLEQQLQTYINQVGELRAKLGEQLGLLKIKDQKIHELQVNLETKADSVGNMEQEFAMRVQDRLKQFMDTEDQYKERITRMERELLERSAQTQSTKQDSFRQITELKDKLSSQNLKISELESEVQDSRANVDREHKLHLELRKQVADLKSEIMQNELLVGEARDAKSDATDAVQNMEKVFNELRTKYDDIKTEHKNLVNQTAENDARYQAYIDFKNKNENAIINLNNLLKIFEEEPLFKTYIIIKDVGRIRFDDLKSSLGLPQITVKKYVEKLKSVELIEEKSDGKISLTNPI
jgi:chromosome segregation ATPase